MSPMSLLARAASGAACTLPKHLEEYHKPLIGGLSFHMFNIYLSGACTLVASVLATALLFEHATHLSNPSQQIKIMRIIHMLPTYAGLSFLSICWPETYVYLNAWIEYFQALALYAFLLLLIDFLAPTDQDKLSYFGSLKVKKIFRRGKYREGVSFLKVTLYCVMQYPFFITLTGITQCITQAFNVYCLNSDSTSYAHLYLKILTNAPLAIAMMAILRFYNVCRKDMKELHPLRKLLAFKLVVGVIFVESILFTILSSHGVLHQTEDISLADIYIGMPNMLICVQMVPLALLMRWAYSAKEYKLDNFPGGKFAGVSGEAGYSRVLHQDRAYQGGRFGYRAWLAYLNPLKIWKDGMAMRTLLREVRLRGQTINSWPEASSEELKTKAASRSSQSSHSDEVAARSLLAP